MSETNWTPEPWNYWNEKGEDGDGNDSSTFNIQGVAGDIIAIVDDGWFRGESSVTNEANARRIIACVNACAGIPDPASEIERLRRVEVAAREVSDILFRASLSSNWNMHGVAILDAHAKLAAALKEPANG